jgi:heptaprenyl diphosphate synthase/octaprenyl-diphosphate synthase
MAHTPLHLGVPEQRLNELAATTRTMPIGLGDILRRALAEIGEFVLNRKS